jgi:hypothetical protein
VFRGCRAVGSDSPMLLKDTKKQACRTDPGPATNAEPRSYSPSYREGFFPEIRSPPNHVLGSPAYLTREGWSAASKARREEGPITSTMMRTATTSSTALRTRIPTVGPRNTPGAPARRLSTQTMMVAR